MDFSNGPFLASFTAPRLPQPRPPAASMFQSSPGQKAGCNRKRQEMRHDEMRFQSSPGQKAGCNAARLRPVGTHSSVSILTRPEGRVQRHRPGGDQHRRPVSILTRPEGRVQHRPRAGARRVPPVSILTRPEGRVQPPSGVWSAGSQHRFNPHPARRPGATPGSRHVCPPTVCFNPHPARRPGATSGKVSSNSRSL